MKLKRIITRLAILAIIITAVYICVPKAHRIDTSINAVEMSSSDGNVIKPVTITINGVYRHSLFDKDTFDGDIRLDTIDVPQGSLTKIIFDLDGYGAMSYRTENGVEFSGHYINMNKNANEIIICIFEGRSNGNFTWNYHNGTVIIFPETDISKQKSRLYGWYGGT